MGGWIAAEHHDRVLPNSQGTPQGVHPCSRPSGWGADGLGGRRIDGRVPDSSHCSLALTLRTTRSRRTELVGTAVLHLQGEVAAKRSEGAPFRADRRTRCLQEVATASEHAVCRGTQPDDFRSVGPLRLLRRHLPPRGEDCENDDVLPLQGEVSAKRSAAACRGTQPDDFRTVRTTMSSPFRGRWPRSGRRGPHLSKVFPLSRPTSRLDERSRSTPPESSPFRERCPRSGRRGPPSGPTTGLATSWLDGRSRGAPANTLSVRSGHSVRERGLSRHPAGRLQVRGPPPPAAQAPPPRGGRTVRTTMSSPFRERCPRSAQQRPVKAPSRTTSGL